MAKPELTVGLDVGGTKILAVAIDRIDPANPVATARVETPRGADELIDALAGAVDAVRTEMITSGRDGRQVAAVGLGVPGLVDHSGIFRYGPNLPGVVEVNLRERLERRLDLPVVVENDATASTWAEFVVGAAQSVNDAVLVTLGTGIGGGVVSGGRLITGTNGFAGEPGHMMVDPTGPRCTCGRQGCWETYASGRGLGYLGRRAAIEGRGARILELADGELSEIRGEHVAVAFREGDPGAITVMDEFGRWLAIGIANLVNVLDPEMVIVGGGVVDIGARLIRTIEAAYRSVVVGVDHRPPVAIVGAQLGSRAGAIGCALLAAGDRDEGTTHR